MDLEATFGHWPAGVHDTPDQQKRMTSAKKKETTPESIDLNTQTGVFPGSGKSPYRTSLESCTCADFLRRKLPCKHIYRLAFELGLLEGNFDTGINKNLSLGIDKIVATLESYSDATQMRISKLLIPFITPNEPVDELTILCDEESAELLTCHFFTFSPLPLKEIMGKMRMNDLKAILQNQGVEPPKVRNKAALIEYCLECDFDWSNLLPKYYVLSLQGEFRRKARQTRSYLKRKYEWDEYYNENMQRIRYPAGAKEQDIVITFSKAGVQCSGDPNLYFFPDDEVTRLLTLYGHNRCLNGFAGEEVK